MLRAGEKGKQRERVSERDGKTIETWVRKIMNNKV